MPREALNILAFGITSGGLVRMRKDLRDLLPPGTAMPILRGLNADAKLAAHQIGTAAKLDVVLVSCGGRYQPHEVAEFVRHIAPHISAHPDDPVACVCDRFARLGSILEEAGCEVDRVNDTRDLVDVLERRL